MSGVFIQVLCYISPESPKVVLTLKGGKIPLSTHFLFHSYLVSEPFFSFTASDTEIVVGNNFSHICGSNKQPYTKV